MASKPRIAGGSGGGARDRITSATGVAMHVRFDRLRRRIATADRSAVPMGDTSKTPAVRGRPSV
jgi:hypothetical protein